jgi:hypothetical protein
MPARKRKRRYLQVKPSPRAASFESVLEVPEEFKNPSLGRDALCERCDELELRDGLYSLNLERGCSAKLSSKILQRLLFDDVPPEPDVCITCQRLRKFTAEQGRLRASRVYQIGMGTTESHKLYADSWFTLDVDELCRTTQKHKRYDNSFVSWLAIRRRNRPPKRYYKTLEKYLPLSSNPLPQSARKVLAVPNYAAVSTWLQHCSKNHAKCRPLKSNSLKLISLIDVDTKRIVPYPLTRKGQCDYIALSYVWGDSKILIDKHGEMPRVLPQTICDSIEVVKQLGKKYLWVDSICINQSVHAEKVAQIQIMDTIYECAFATIIAMNGKSANDGLPGLGAGGTRTQQIYAEFGENLLVEKLPRLDEIAGVSPWASRAWTYQEGLLSRRRIFFTEHQLYFVCNEMDCCESLEDSSKSLNNSWRIAQSSPLYHYRYSHGYRTVLSQFLRDPLIDRDVEGQSTLQKVTLLEDFIYEYAQRELSRDEDSLNAVSALLQYMQRVIFQDGFLCGLPLANFRNSILWHENHGSTILLDGSTTKRRNAANIPSWSWAAWHLNNRITFPRSSRFLEAWVKPLNPPLSIASYGEMKIDVDKSINGMDGSDAKDFDLEDCLQIQQMTSATLAFYNSVEAKTIRDSSDSTMPVAIQGPKSDHSVLWVEGIIIKFSWLFDDESLPCELRELAGEVYYWGPQSCPKLSKSRGNVYQEFLLVSVLGDRFSGMRLDLLRLLWEDGIAFRGGVASIDVEPQNAREFWEGCDATLCRFWFS